MLGVSAELDLDGPVGALDLPRIAIAQPGVGVLYLHAIDDALLEDAVLVTDAVADGGNLQRRQRIHEACGQPAQATITKAWFGFLREQHVEIESEFAHGF